MIFLTLILLAGLYFAPWLIALERRRQPAAIFVLNLLGFTGLCWIIALVWALSDGPRSPKRPNGTWAMLFGTRARRQGEWAARNRLSRDDNPYDAGTTDHRHWAEGWDFEAFMFTSPC